MGFDGIFASLCMNKFFRVGFIKIRIYFWQGTSIFRTQNFRPVHFTKPKTLSLLSAINFSKRRSENFLEEPRWEKCETCDLFLQLRRTSTRIEMKGVFRTCFQSIRRREISDFLGQKYRKIATFGQKISFYLVFTLLAIKIALFLSLECENPL